MKEYEVQSIREFIVRQLEKFAQLEGSELDIIDFYLPKAIDRTLYCFRHVREKYLVNTEQINIFNSVQCTVFLYFLANCIFKGYASGESALCGGGGHKRLEDKILCDKLYMIYKSLSNFELYYEVDMPNVFYFAHPMGAVIGRAEYSDGFFFYQGCTVGENLPTGSGHPKFGENCLMCANSTVLGNCHVGNNVIISANAYIKDVDIPSNSIVFGQFPNYGIKPNNTRIVLDLFDL